jgi:hypothetical protein
LSRGGDSTVTPREAAEIEAKKTYQGFIKWSKVTIYWILAILILLAFFDYGADTETGSQYNGAVYEPRNLGND